MSLRLHALPSARREDDELRRYVRSEYGERDSCWFQSSCAKGSLKHWTAESGARAPAAPIIGRTGHARAERCCPVLGAIDENRLTKGLASRGGIAGEP